MRPARASPAQRRSDAAPLGLVLAGWVVAVAPVAHPLLAHGTPFLRTGADEGWVHHAEGHAPSVPSLPPEHRHAPGSPEHLQLPLLAAAPAVAFRTAVLALRRPASPTRRALSLARRWSQEQPQAP
jgi:hypothetical protein